ncbi:hypothetical protein ACHAXT_002913 [Thalassiosira profunda]
MPVDPDQIWHFAKAALLALVASLLVVVTQIRSAFHKTREDFVSFQRQRSEERATAKQDKRAKKSAKEDGDGTFVIGFFHPRCTAGGGGERVLWKSIQALGELREGKVAKRRTKTKKESGGIDGDDVRLQNCRNLSVVVYTIDKHSDNYDEEVREKVRERFSITVPSSLPLHFVHLHELAWCALGVVTPHVFVDTTGCAFTFFVAKVLAGCKVATYVHYPTISTDMLSLVRERRPSYNNDAKIAANPLVTYAKLAYYSMFAVCYGLVGSLADLTMVNSTWTKGHIQYLWRLAGKIHVVFPPVDTKSLKELPLKGRENLILSIGQFRPEKDHVLQLQSFAKMLEMYDGAMRTAGAKLILIGSCRGDDDQERVDQLQRRARELGIQDNVSFVLNQPASVLKDYLRRASVGLHTMWNEHFGIGVVEMMAAGLVTVAHNSGGPRSDIILRPAVMDPTGCLASTAEEYATAMYEILGASPEVALQIRENGRKSAERFSDEVFMDSFKETLLASPIFRQ